jgi:hypothetical protein
MKYIYIIYSNLGGVAYIGSTCDTLKQRLTYHRCDVKKKKFTISSKEVLMFPDFKIDYIYEFDDDLINNYDLLKIEHNLIEKYYYKNDIYKNFIFKNKKYRIVNKRRVLISNRYICPCGCEKILTRRVIKRHLINQCLDINNYNFNNLIFDKKKRQILN